MEVQSEPEQEYNCDACCMCGRSRRKPWWVFGGEDPRIYGERVCFSCRSWFHRRRFLGVTIDAVFIYLVTVLAIIGFSGMFASAASDADPVHPTAKLVGGASIISIGIVSCLGFLLFRDSFGGRSVGKFVCGLQVIAESSHEPIGFLRSFLRNVTLILSQCIPFGPLIGIWLYLQKEGLRVGDDVAQTRVITRKYAGTRPFPNPSKMSLLGWAFEGFIAIVLGALVFVALTAGFAYLLHGDDFYVEAHAEHFLKELRSGNYDAAYAATDREYQLQNSRQSFEIDAGKYDVDMDCTWTFDDAAPSLGNDVPREVRGVIERKSGNTTSFKLTLTPDGIEWRIASIDLVTAESAEKVLSASSETFAVDAPLEEQWHDWTSADGKYTTRAKYLKLEGDSVQLEKEDESVISVQLDRLSEEDRALVNELAQPEEKPKPDEWRLWTSADGQHTVEAKFVEVRDGTLRFERRDGQIATIPLERLSAEDQDFLEKLLSAHGKVRQNEN